MSKSALLLAFVAASCLSPAMAIPLGADRGAGFDAAAPAVGPHRPGLVVNPTAQQGSVVMGPRRPGAGTSAGNGTYLADR